MLDVKLRKANKRIEELTEKLSQASMGILNMRNMYEGATQEKLGLQSQVSNLQSMLTAVVAQGRGKRVRIKAKTLEELVRYAGIDSKVDGEDVILTVLTVEQIKEMQDDIEEDTE